MWSFSNYLQFVVALRHPYAVALSLQKRNGISLTRGQLMWAAYTLPFLPHIKNYPHVFISYDDLLEQPALVLEKSRYIWHFPLTRINSKFMLNSF